MSIMIIHRSTKLLERFYIINKHILAQVDKAKYIESYWIYDNISFRLELPHKKYCIKGK